MGKEAGENLSPSAVTVISKAGFSPGVLHHGFSLESDKRYKSVFANMWPIVDI